MLQYMICLAIYELIKEHVKKLIDISMFLKLANSDIENGLKKIKNVPRRNLYTEETGNWKRHVLVGTRIIRP